MLVGYLDFHQPVSSMQLIDEAALIQRNRHGLLLVAIDYGRDLALFTQFGGIFRPSMLSNLCL
jgi:hypothetical protein